jgi:Kef-type K+ transport system membrane component KefB
LLGLTFVLFLGGTEVDPDRLRGAPVKKAVAGFVVTMLIGIAAGFALDGLGLVTAPLLVAVALSATSLGVLLAVLTESHRTPTEFGQQVIANASVADFGSVLLLSLLFGGMETSATTRLLLLGGLAVLVVVAAKALTAAERRLPDLLGRLEGGASEIQVRLAIVLMLSFATIALMVGVEAILGAFLAGAILSFVARRSMIEARLQPKLEGVGYGFLVPVFFVTAGLRFDLPALLSGGGLALIPVFALALLAVRGVPALLFERQGGLREAAATGLLQATSLSFLVTASQIGLIAGLLEPGAASALVGAGLVSVALFPPVALALLTQSSEAAATPVVRGQPAKP